MQQCNFFWHSTSISHLDAGQEMWTLSPHHSWQLWFAAAHVLLFTPAGSAAGPSLFLFSVSEKHLGCGRSALRILTASQNSRLLQLFSAPHSPACCVEPCFLIFPVSASSYRSKLCTLMLCFQRDIVIGAFIFHFVSLVMPFTKMTCFLQPFFSTLSHSVNHFEVFFWTRHCLQKPEVAPRRAVFQRGAAPSASFHLSQGSHSRYRWRGRNMTWWKKKHS